MNQISINAIIGKLIRLTDCGEVCWEPGVIQCLSNYSPYIARRAEPDPSSLSGIKVTDIPPSRHHHYYCYVARTMWTYAMVFAGEQHKEYIWQMGPLRALYLTAQRCHEQQLRLEQRRIQMETDKQKQALMAWECRK